MTNCEKCGGVVDGLFCPKCDKADPKPIPTHVRAELDRLKALWRASASAPKRERQPGEDDE